MGKMKFIIPIFFCALASCSSVAFDDKHFQLDNVPGKELRGDIPAHDLPLSYCEPIEVTDENGNKTKQYKCVVHEYADYDKLLNRITDLENQLVACQQGHQQ